MSTNSVVSEPQVRLGTLKNGGKAAPLTAEVRAKGLETRRRRKAEAEVRKWEQLEPLALKRLGELLLKADDAVAQRAIADYLDRRPDTARISRTEHRSLSVTASLDEVRGLSDEDLAARLAELPAAPE